jgi:hypothetical protein
MTDNIMIKRKETKGQTMIYKTLHRKLKTNTNPPLLITDSPAVMQI